MDQRSDDWFNARLGCITASQISKVLSKGKGRQNYIEQLAEERINGKRLEKQFTSAAMQWGIDNEPLARRAYEKYRNMPVEEVGFILHPTIEYAGASPDGLVGKDGLVEIKCPNTNTHLKSVEKNYIKPEYIKQMQWQMACTGRKWCDFVSYDPRAETGRRFFQKRVERDAEIISTLEQSTKDLLREVGAIISGHSSEIPTKTEVSKPTKKTTVKLNTLPQKGRRKPTETSPKDKRQTAKSPKQQGKRINSSLSEYETIVRNAIRAEKDDFSFEFTKDEITIDFQCYYQNTEKLFKAAYSKSDDIFCVSYPDYVTREELELFISRNSAFFLRKAQQSERYRKQRKKTDAKVNISTHPIDEQKKVNISNTTEKNTHRFAEEFYDWLYDVLGVRGTFIIYFGTCAFVYSMADDGGMNFIGLTFFSIVAGFGFYIIGAMILAAIIYTIGITIDFIRNQMRK